MDAVRLLFELAMPLTQEFQFLMNLDRWVEIDAQVSAIYEKQQRDLTELVEYGKSRGEFEGSFPTSWLVNLVEGLFYIGWQHQQEERTPPEVVAKLAFATFQAAVSVR